MQTLSNITTAILSLLTIALFVWVGWQAYQLLVGQQQLLEPNTQSALIIVAIIALVCSHMIGRSIRSAGVLAALGAQKARVYEQYLQHRMFNETLDDRTWNELKAALTLLASPHVMEQIKKIEEALKHSTNNSADLQTALLELATQMRMDLGTKSYFNTRKKIEELLNQSQHA